ncbi:MAG: DUF2007 domain-containing protein [Tannerellaceae bacterium]|jgi:hypothetical protein|nr:DUF2007 domain-containing protein [Tannerellaceae bacterium]
MDTTDKIVEIARFRFPAEAYTLMATLRSEGIDCYLRNEYSSGIAGYPIGGARVEIMESDVVRAMEVMEAGGYEIPAVDEIPKQITTVTGWAGRIPLLRKLPLEMQIFVFFIIIAVCIGLLIWLGTL